MPVFSLRRHWTPTGRRRARGAAPSARRKQQHHRGAVLWLVAGFALSQLLLALWIDQGSLAIRDPEYTLLRDRLRQRAAEHPGWPVAAFLGSSRVAFGFDARRAAGGESAVVFNFGVPGSGPFLHDVLHERLTRDGVRPDVLFVEVMPAFYNAAGGKPLDHLLLDGSRLTAGELASLGEYGVRSTRPFRRWAAARAVPVSRHHAELRDRLGLDVFRPGEAALRPLDDVDAFGFRPHPNFPEERPALTAVAHGQYDRFYPAFVLDPKPFGRLVRTVRRARENGSRVVAVMMPEGSEFRRLYTPASTAGVNDLVSRLRSKTGAEVVDARDWLDDGAFYDQHHMIADGAVAFARRFHTEVLVPTLKK